MDESAPGNVSGEAANGGYYAVFVLKQFIDTPGGTIAKVRDYAGTWDDCLARKNIESQIRPGANLACVIQNNPPLPTIDRDGMGGLLLMAIIAFAITARKRRASA